MSVLVPLGGGQLRDVSGAEKKEEKERGTERRGDASALREEGKRQVFIVIALLEAVAAFGCRQRWWWLKKRMK
jgi:hypothetical protein